MTLDAPVLMASAGSGKTWMLTTRYLRLVANGVEPERVLASTFTRKAAAEILARIFGRLAAAAENDAARAELDGALRARRTAGEYRKLLAELARDVQRLRVRTLDSFFVELAQALAPELALPPGWSVADELDTRRARDRALATALERGQRGEWIELLSELERNRPGRSVHEALIRVIAEAHGLLEESSAAAWDLPQPIASWPEERITQLIAALAEVESPLNQGNRQPNKAWTESLARARAAAAARDWVAMFVDGIGLNVACGKEEFNRHPIPEELRELYHDFARQAASGLSAEIAAQNRATRRLLEAFDALYRGVQREAGRIGFDDLAHSLARGTGALARERRGDLAARLGTRIDHLLLDEFQDTSPVQWRVLAPVAEELAGDSSGERSFFCVGDVKQSIYGWRAAEPRLLEGLPARLCVEHATLDESRRSAQIVLDAVNRVFRTLPHSPALQGKLADVLAAQAFSESMHDHRAVDPSSQGAVNVHTCATAEDQRGRWEECVETSARIVSDIRAHEPEASIAVLLRRNALGPSIVRRLRESGIAASDEGGNPLTDSIAVQAALALLHWLDHPGDTLARFHVASSVFAQPLGLSPSASNEHAARIHERARRARLDRGTAEWLSDLRGAMESALGAWEARRFGQLIDLALYLGSQASPRTRELVDRVRVERVEDSSPAQVKVMTIHASKGLEFDAVVLPELELRFVRQPPRFLWRRRNEDPTSEIEYVSRNAEVLTRQLVALGGDARLEELEASTRMRSMRDELSALYVGMTRARHRLDLVLWPNGAAKDAPKSSPAGVIRHAFGLGHGSLAPSTAVFADARNSERWMRARSAPAPARSDAESSTPAFTFLPARRSRELERESPSELGRTSRIATAELLAPSERAARLRGARFHVWLERVEWRETFAEGDAALLELARAAGFGGEALDEHLAEFRGALARPGLRALLARTGAESEVWRERRFFHVLESGSPSARLRSGAFDRVVLWRSNGKPERAELIDFKTDRVAGNEAALATHVERYRAQIEAYSQALVRITGLAPERVSAALFFLDLDRRVDL